jgi:hypothetical protein
VVGVDEPAELPEVPPVAPVAAFWTPKVVVDAALSLLVPGVVVVGMFWESLLDPAA